MKFPYGWLKEWIELDLGAEEVADVLTMGGLEVEERVSKAPEFSGVVVAEVLEVSKHPGADRLKLTKVDAGGDEPLGIVCGAPNVKPGIKVPCATVGARLPGGLRIKAAKMRGEPSMGMLCSAVELGLGAAADGLMILPADARVGRDLREELDLDEQIFELKITPNRQDCLGMLGIARDLSALTGAKLVAKERVLLEPVIPDQVTPSIEAPEDCGRFVTRVIKDVDRSVPTPSWMAERLELSGIRPVEFLVDVGNYVMLELGQPMHVFDLAKIEGGLVARRAKEGETLLCLNGKTVTLDAETLVIADSKKALSIAGLMGGEESSVGPSTTDVCLESAWFRPDAIRGRSKRYGFGSESSYRFERGVDSALQRRACERATELIVRVAGGRPGPVSEALGRLPETATVKLRQDRIAILLGIEIAPERVLEILESLGFECESVEDGLEVKVPTWRFDVKREVDLIEDVARVHGYDNIPFRNPDGDLLMTELPGDLKPLFRVKGELCAMGYQEVVNYAFCEDAWERDYGAVEDPVKLLNPLVAGAASMRTTLIASLVDNLAANVKRKSSRVRIFEAARVFRRYAEGEPEEDDVSFKQTRKLGFLIWGAAREEAWTGDEDSRPVDFYDLKGDVARLLETARSLGAVSFVAKERKFLHPGRSAEILIDGEPAGFIGELHPRLVRQADLSSAPMVAELDLDVVLDAKPPRHCPVSKFPPARRDVALVVPEEVTHDEFLAALKGKAWDPIVSSARVFDVYRGKGVPENAKSVALKLILNHDERTLKDEEMDKVVSDIVERAKERGWTLRA